ncbi:MAG: flippase-like domain-containing protein [Cytophagales bacterium]|nr:flippase-like domain-containing protein [Cytophagales bacterium]MDW8384520.1 lysylphosphatidylglycerol synthase transmembrane domain-containing protein [Flammeovirgaceae bacterium]
MLKKILIFLRYFLLWSLPFVLLFWALRHQDFKTLWITLQNANFSWAVAIGFITVTNHWVRAKRWQISLEPIQRVSTWHLFLALMFGYLITFVIPRVGEIARCSSLYKTDKVPLHVSIGTVITERAIDIICLGIVVVLSFALEWKILVKFYELYLQTPLLVGAEQFFSLQTRIIIIGCCVALGVLFFLSLCFQKQYSFLHQKTHAFLQKLKEGIFSLQKIRKPWVYVSYTIYIWFTYWLMTYWWFFSFPQTSHLSPSVGIAMMTVSSLARLLPIQGGGMGAYHYLFSEAMFLFGIPMLYGNALAILVHGFQSAYYLLVGGICSWILFRKV